MNHVAISHQISFASRFRTALGSRYTREPFILLGAYFLYYMARHLADDAKPAFENARYLMKVEQSFGEGALETCRIFKPAVVTAD